MNEIIVTGGSGYIGQAVCRALYASNYRVIVIDNLSTSKEPTPYCDEHLSLDLRSPKLTKHLKTYKNVNAVIHLAASAYVGESNRNPSKYYSNNIESTKNLLDAMLSNDIQNILYSSTCTVYDPPTTNKKVSENHRVNPISPYGFTKLVSEQMIRDYSNSYGLNALALRYFNAAGADVNNGLGMCYGPEKRLIPIVIESALNESTFYINGNNYNTKDGTCVRDFIHIKDLAVYHVKALKMLISNNIEHTHINLGTGKGYSIKDIISMTSEIIHKKVPFSVLNRREGDAPYLVSDNSLAKSVFQFEPIYSIEDIINSSYELEIMNY